MTFSEWISILSCLGAVIVSLVGGTWILRGMFADFSEKQDVKFKEHSIENSDRVATALVEADKKIARVYERFDVYKNFVDGKMDAQISDLDTKYVRRRECDILHCKTAEQVAEMKVALQASIKRLEEKVDVLMTKQGSYGKVSSV